MNSKRALSFVLALLLLCGTFAFTGCKKETPAVKTLVTNVYKEKNIPKPDGLAYISECSVVGGRIFITGYNKDYSGNAAYSMALDGSDLTEIKLPVIDNGDGSTTDKPITPRDDIVVAYEASYVTDTVISTTPGDIYYPTQSTSKNINYYIFTTQGYYWYILSENTYDQETYETTSKYTLCKASDTDASLLFSADLTELAGTDMENNYINSVKGLSDGSIIIQYSDCLLKISSDGKLVSRFMIETGDDKWVNNLVVTSSGEVYIFYAGAPDYNTKMTKADFSAGKANLEENLLEGTSIEGKYYNYFTGTDGYDFMYSNDTGIYGYKTGAEPVILLNWLNSDIDYQYNGNMTAVDADRFITIGNDPDTNEQLLVVYTRVPDSENVSKYIITLGCTYLEYNVRRQIIRFNKSSNEYRVVVKDYSEYNTDDDYNRAVTMLNNDIISGNIPDVLVYDSYSSIPYDSYASKGLFADLYKFMDAEENGLDRSLYYGNVLKALETNGKLYAVVPSFTVSTFAGKKKFFADYENGITVDELKALISRMPEGTIPFLDVTQKSLLYYACTMGYDSFVDNNTGKCSFDSAGFKSMLEFAKTMDATSFWDDMNSNWDEEKYQEYMSKYQNAYKDDIALLSEIYLSGFDSLQYSLWQQFGEETVFVGFPTADRNGASLSADLLISLSSKSSVSAGAWQFVRSFLEEEYQTKNVYQWPLLKYVTEQKKVDFLKDQEERKQAQNGDPDAGSGIILYNEATVSSAYPWYPTDSHEFTEAELDAVTSYISSVNKLTRYNESVMNTISEEADAYFAGTKSLEETVKIIQNRCQITISESR